MTYESLSLADGTAHQLGCMLLDDRSLQTLEVLQGVPLILIPNPVSQILIPNPAHAIWIRFCIIEKHGTRHDNVVRHLFIIIRTREAHSCTRLGPNVFMI